MTCLGDILDCALLNGSMLKTLASRPFLCTLPGPKVEAWAVECVWTWGKGTFEYVVKEESLFPFFYVDVVCLHEDSQC